MLLNTTSYLLQVFYHPRWMMMIQAISRLRYLLLDQGSLQKVCKYTRGKKISVCKDLCAILLACAVYLSLKDRTNSRNSFVIIITDSIMPTTQVLTLSQIKNHGKNDYLVNNDICTKTSIKQNSANT